MLEVSHSYLYSESATMPSRLERLILLDQELRRGYYPSVERLCRLFEVQPRTVFQDIKDLRERLGLEIKFDRSRGGYFNADPDKKLPSFSLTEQELFALYLGAAVIRVELDDVGRQIVEHAMRKLYSASAVKWTEHPENMFDAVDVVTQPCSAAGISLLHKLFVAIATGKEVISPDSGVKILPVQLQRAAYNWFLLAKDLNQVGICFSIIENTFTVNSP